jgi:hypothetical protein
MNRGFQAGENFYYKERKDGRVNAGIEEDS